ncbi:MAG: hypothetical protein IAE62_04510 [Flavobacteriales bacterium]|nr:hypothetical protein [Flavobacteriales bacterium]
MGQPNFIENHIKFVAKYLDFSAAQYPNVGLISSVEQIVERRFAFSQFFPQISS